jgi:hypothetical protein
LPDWPAAKAGDPEGCPFERARKRLHLARATTGMPGFDAVVKAVQAVLGGIGVDIVLFGIKALDQDAIGFFGLVDQRHGLVEEPAGLQRRDLDADACLCRSQR